MPFFLNTNGLNSAGPLGNDRAAQTEGRELEFGVNDLASLAFQSGSGSDLLWVRVVQRDRRSQRRRAERLDELPRQCADRHQGGGAGRRRQHQHRSDASTAATLFNVSDPDGHPIPFDGIS